MPLADTDTSAPALGRKLVVGLLSMTLLPLILSAEPTLDEFMAVTATVTVLDISSSPVEEMEVWAVEHHYGLRTSAVTDASGVAELAIMPGTWTFIANPTVSRVNTQPVSTGIFIVEESVDVPQSPSFNLTVQATDTVTVSFVSTIFDFTLGGHELKLVAEPLGRFIPASTVGWTVDSPISLQTHAGLPVTAAIYSPRHWGPESLLFVENGLSLTGTVEIEVTNTNSAILRFDAHLPTGDPAKADINLHTDSLSWAWSAVPFGLHDAWPQDIRVSAGGYQVLRAIQGTSDPFEAHLTLDNAYVELQVAETKEMSIGGPLVGPVVRTTPRPSPDFGDRTQIMALFEDSYGNYVRISNNFGQPMWPEFVVHHDGTTSAPFENFIFHAAGIWEQFPREEDPTYEITWDFGSWGSGSATGPLYGQEERRMDNDESPSLLGQVPRFSREDRDLHMAEYEDLVQVMEQALGVPVDYKMGVISNINWAGFEDEVQHGFKLEYGLELDRPWGTPAVGAAVWYANHEAGHGRTLLPPLRFGTMRLLTESYATLVALKAASMRFGGADYLRFLFGHHGEILSYRHGTSTPEAFDSIELMQFITNYINENYGWLPHKRMLLEWQNSFLPFRAALQANGYTIIEQFATIYSWLCGENLGALFEASGQAVTSARVSTGLGVIDTVISGFTEPALKFGVNDILAPRFSAAVELQAPASASVTSLSFTLTFDASQVVFEEAYRRDLTDSDGWILTAVPGAGPGTLEVSLLGGSTSWPVGTVAQFNFRALPDAAGTLAFALSDVLVNGDPKAPAAGSYFTPIGPVIGPFPTLPTATPGESYSTSLWAIGGQPPYSWSVVEDSLPPGFSLDSSSGELSGTAGSIGEFLFRVRCQDSGTSVAHRWYTLKISAETYLLTVDLAGSGSGAVTSVPSGIDCGSDCSEVFDEGLGVTLSATPSTGSVFAGWTGDPDCTNGIVTMDTNKTCTANFDLTSQQLTVEMDGAGTGTVFSDPPGIDCGFDCEEQYPFGTVVSLTPSPDGDSLFLGWFGNADCADGQVTMDTGKTCIARFDLAADVTFADSFESGDTSAWSSTVD